MINTSKEMSDINAAMRQVSRQAEPLLADLIQVIHKQKRFLPNAYEAFKAPGWEALNPQRIGHPFYELLISKPTLSAVLAVSASASISVFPGSTLLGLSVITLTGVFGYQALRLVGVNIHNDVEILQSMKPELSKFLEKLIETKKLLAEKEQTSEPDACKRKKYLIQNLIKLCGNNLYMRLRESKPIKVNTLIDILDACKELFCHDDDLYFNYIWLRSKYVNAPSAQVTPDTADTAAGLNLGEAPKETAREDAISAGIAIARKLSALEVAPKKKRPPSKKSSTVVKNQAAEEAPAAPLIEDNADITPSAESQPQDKPGADNQSDLEQSTTTDTSSPATSEGEDIVSEKVTIDGPERPGAVSLGHVVSDEVAGENFNEEDLEVYNELKRRDESRILDMTSSSKTEESEEDGDCDTGGLAANEDDEDDLDGSSLDLPDDDDLPDGEYVESDDDDVSEPEGLDSFMSDYGEEDGDKK